MALARRGPAALLLLALPLAGCLSTGADPSTLVAPPAENPAGAVLAGLFEAHECQQYHMFFTSPADGVASFVPEGFTLITGSSGQTVSVFVGTTVCGHAATGAWTLDHGSGAGMFYAAIPVEPPEELRANDIVDRVPLDGIASPNLAEKLAVWGLGEVIVPGDVHITRDADTPAAIAEVISARAGGNAYTLRTTLRPSSGDFGAEVSRLWVVKEGKAVGAVLEEPSESQNLGAGPVAFTYEGSGGAPPVSAGIAHTVGGMSLKLSPWARAMG